MYATLVRNAGWTYAQCREQCAIDAFDFLNHLAEHPPDYVILAAVHMERKSKRGNEAETSKDLHELGAMMGSGMEAAPDDFGDTVAWAEAMQGKLKG